jgi:hypothetical protein
MFVRKICILIAVAFLGGVVYASEASNNLQAFDSIGMMPEVVVTAPRYENQDEAWAGLVQGIVVEAQRFLPGEEETDAGVIGGSMSASEINPASMRSENSFRLLVSLTLALATISILYITTHVYLAAKEVELE